MMGLLGGETHMLEAEHMTNLTVIDMFHDSVVVEGWRYFLKRTI